jgi:hypothetical protein
MRKVFKIMAVLIIAGIVYFFWRRATEVPTPQTNTGTVDHYVTYQQSEYGPIFSYPQRWGTVAVQKGNEVCPEEDTYRSPETLSVFDWEFSFSNLKLPGTESMLRSGVRVYELDPTHLNTCGDDFLVRVARKEIDPRTISSVLLMPVTNKNGLTGIYTAEASRLNTESRRQYTFFVPSRSGFYVLQPYISFIPYFGSPELAEMEHTFGGDMEKYIRLGKTAEPIREYFAELATIAENLQFKGEE